MPLTVEAFDHIVLNVEDVELAASWYQRVLGMRREMFLPPQSEDMRTALIFGKQKINLRPIAAGADEWSTGDHVSTGSADLCFLTQSQPDDVVMHLGTVGVPVEVGPVQRRGAQGTLISVYCRDPDGNLIEIASYRT